MNQQDIKQSLKHGKHMLEKWYPESSYKDSSVRLFYVIAIACMELQIAKKPIEGLTIPDGYGTKWKITECECGLNLNNDSMEKYCTRCGQRILWEDYVDEPERC